MLDPGCARRRTSQFDLSARRLASARVATPPTDSIPDPLPLSLRVSRFTVCLSLTTPLPPPPPPPFSASRTRSYGYQVTQRRENTGRAQAPSGRSTLSTGISGLSFTGRQVHLTSRAPGPARFFPAADQGHGWIERLRRR